MARDYKHRANSAKKKVIRKKPRVNSRTKIKAKPSHVPLGRWLLAFGLLAGFMYGLSSLEPEEKTKTKTKEQAQSQVIEKTPKKIVVPLVKKKAAIKVPIKVPVKAPIKTPIKTPIKKVLKQEVQYDFYTLLPEAEFTIPDYEVKSIKRAERVGKAVKNREYSVQVSSFRRENDADSLKAKLLLLGFSPKIEKAQVKGATWYRVKIGPYQQIKSVDAVVSRLKEKNIVEKSFSKANTFPFETKTSFQRDIESKGKINESDLFGGTLIRYGERLNTPVENIKRTYNKLLTRLN